MQINPYLFYDGNCEAAFKFYEKTLGGKIEMMLRNEDAPDEMPSPPERKKKIMHGQDFDRWPGADGVRCAARPFPQAAGLFGLADGRRPRRSRAQVQGALSRAAASTCRLGRPSSPRASACASTSSAFPGWSTARWRATNVASSRYSQLSERLPARRVDRRKVAATQQQQARRQSAAALNPAPHRGGIGFEHQFGGFRLGIQPAAPVHRSRGVKSQHGPARHADALVWNHAQHQRASRQARTIDHDALAGGADAFEQIKERADLSARTAEDAYLGARRLAK